jgi:type I pantothenate kinase
MSQSEELSAYTTFGRSTGTARRFNTPLTLSEAHRSAHRGLNEPIGPAEVAEIYLPLTRLLNLHFTAARGLADVKSGFLGRAPRIDPKYRP